MLADAGVRNWLAGALQALVVLPPDEVESDIQSSDGLIYGSCLL